MKCLEPLTNFKLS
ncbi:hypothetical protein QN277_023016 [Acacia crassicarpa]|uniref:Uncharacterized protein n=1 Tax=Acacia crassicarpa TaxID=499986 RepID=A0AAE1MMK8_9FABA|nr:hypothetical protein QN277_023016 [Acacia crassicarpa]